MKHIKTFGGILLFFGILSIVMDFFNRVPSIMAWIYSWGETTAWIIKIAFVVVGFAIARLGAKDEKEKQQIEEHINPNKTELMKQEITKGEISEIHKETKTDENAPYHRT